jgi:hypothetical protein
MISIRIVADLRKQQRESGRRYITLPARRPSQVGIANKAVG